MTLLDALKSTTAEAFRPDPHAILAKIQAEAGSVERRIADIEAEASLALVQEIGGDAAASKLTGRLSRERSDLRDRLETLRRAEEAAQTVVDEADAATARAEAADRMAKLRELIARRSDAFSRADAALSGLAGALRDARTTLDEIRPLTGAIPPETAMITPTALEKAMLAWLGAAGVLADRRIDRGKPVPSLSEAAAAGHQLIEALASERAIKKIGA